MFPVHTIKKTLARFKRDESGATAIEYGLFAALIGAVIVTVVASLGTNINLGFTSVNDKLEEAIGTEVEEPTT
ncbi:Flp family type IVb pilin [Oceanicola sp. S124]|uniref:Flp family type IVb pilin n=1 Tax=Oceanicola sp. S124 TaxID=1042378 RepID=UPI0002559725|nr:Flp family type IVb pilin [Oceanicola sp. S124]